MRIIETNFKYKGKLVPLNLEKVFHIVLHHIKADTATANKIHEWHLERFLGFGYNEYIRKDGSVYIGRGDFIGAQCKGMNSKSYGIALEGDFTNGNQMTDEQLDSLIERINYHKDRMPNKVTVEPHNKFVRTECPGKHFPMSNIQRILKDNPRIEELEQEVVKLRKENLSLQKTIEYQNRTIAKVRKSYRDMRGFYQDSYKRVLELEAKLKNK